MHPCSLLKLAPAVLSAALSLVHSNDWYLVKQLEHFKTKVRGNAPTDAEAAQMFPWMTTLSDEQAMKDVVAHIQTLR